MAHDIHVEHGRASIMYVGDEPWHGLGQQLNAPATAAEAIRAANLDWYVLKLPLYARDEGGMALRLPNEYIIVPSHRWGQPDCPIFARVTAEYTPLQNREAFEFFDDIVGAGSAIYHTAGALGRGERVWILAKLPSYFVVADGDICDKYLLLSNSHDGKNSVQVKFTPVRVVCRNTRTMALNNGPAPLKIAHTPNVRERLENARHNLHLINTQYDEIERTIQEFARIEMDKLRLKAYMEQVLPFPADGCHNRDKLIAHVEKQRAAATRLFEDGKGNEKPGVTGTLWAAYNGVTEFIDHADTRRAPSEHLDFMWFGRGSTIKANAYEIGKEFVKRYAERRATSVAR